jgi:SAM-dependent methyltransferase
MLRNIYYLLSPAQRLVARRLAFLPVDFFEKITGRRKGEIPPRGMIYTGTGDFLLAGKLFLEVFKTYGNLKPNHRVLDVGSGIGRMAIPLTGFLNDQGSYEGFDIVPAGVNWCTKRISSKYANFNFRLVHLKNDLYSDTGENASDFRFPYADEEFDFVFLISVFTHMLPEEVENYMKEIGRVLKKGGHCLSTFFVFGEEKEAESNPKFAFKLDHGHYRLMHHKVESANVAFQYEYINTVLAHPHNMKVVHFLPGYWDCQTRKNERMDFQDIVVFRKEE